ncbi:hypothetical protein CDL12_00100 [Handroanthus impetiginosus]|uniref:Uncharacterized protein n=1 Tax=Handroanthus impetiginosus TaxID=429701 RepID=A0A2G9IBJ6_9LAMI|nr:hypothetical protein CDL12_00100 [Handroanthus impetiginosus]
MEVDKGIKLEETESKDLVNRMEVDKGIKLEETERMEVDKGIKLEETERMEVDKRIKLEETESKDIVNSVEKLKKEYEGCIRCLELQEKFTKANEKCGRLELEIEGKLGFLECKSLEIEHENRVLKQRNEELEKSTENDEEEDDRITQLMIENNVLECEKKKAESEIGDWKVKYRELEMKVIELEKRFAGLMKSGLDLPEMDGYNVGGRPSMVRMETDNEVTADKDASGTGPINTPSKQYTGAEGYKGGHQFEFQSRVRKSLDFAAERNSHKNISPSTPGGKPPFGPIDISDSDDDLNDAHMELSESKRRKITRRVACIVTSESEDDSDDNIPICRLTSKHTLGHSSDNLENGKSVNDSCSKDDNSKKISPRRRLIRVCTLEDKGVSGKRSCKSQKNLGTVETTNESTDEDEMEDDDSHSEGESLGGFIVNSSEDSGSNCDDMSENRELSSDHSGDSEHSSESSMAYDEVISGLRRDRKDKMKWDFEADMLADLGKFPELCMKAVCALYRQQTSEEKSCKATIVLNGRGFNHVHAFR